MTAGTWSGPGAGLLAGTAARLAAAPAVAHPWYPVRLRLVADEAAVLRSFADEFSTTEAGAPCLDEIVLRVPVGGTPVAVLAERLCAGSGAVRPVMGYDDLTYQRFDAAGRRWWLSPAENAVGEPGACHLLARDPDGWWLFLDGTSGARYGAVMVRELLRETLLARGGTVVHASAVALDGAAILFCGDGGSGKTTLALTAATHGAALISGDRTVVWPDTGTVDPGRDGEPGRLVATGLGMALRAREGTLHGLGFDRRLAGLALSRSHPTKVILSQPELASVLNLRTTAAAAPDTIVFTRRADGPPRLRALGRGPAVPLLRRQIPEPDTVWHRRWLLDGSGRSEVSADSVADRMLDHVGRWELCWDPTRGEADAVIAALLSVR